MGKHPKDPQRSLTERTVIFLLRYLIPPHADNEKVAAYLLSSKGFRWVVVRPTNLITENEASGKYDVSYQAEMPLFGDQVVSRNNVAHFMVELMAEDEKTFAKYNHKMPVLVGSKNDAIEGEK